MAICRVGKSLVAAMLLLSPALVAQTSVHATRLQVAGRAGDAPVVQVGGRSYVDVESLARITGATLAFQGNRILMTVPGQAAATAPAAPEQQAPVSAPRGSTGFSREFVTAAVSAVSQMREWRATLVHGVQNNQPISEDLMAPYRRQTETQVALASAAARTDQDRSAAALVQSELANLRTLSGNYVGVHDTITNIRTDALDTDPLGAKVLNCMQGLAGMQAGGQFQDVPACH